jgi:thiol-disulfide isomerase/thioredoxin
MFPLGDGMRKTVALWLLIMTGMALLVTPFPRVGRAGVPSQQKCPSCDSFGVQSFMERKEAPPFTLNTLNGKKVSLSDFKGKPVLITFWTTWCDSCKEDIPSLEKLSAGKRDQLTILFIVIDGERKKAVQKIADRHKITIPVLLLLKEKVMDQYGVRGWIPLTFLVNQEGMLVGKIVGQRDWCSPEAWSCLKEIFGLR